MSKNFTKILLFFGVTLSLIVSGCGSANSPATSSATDASQSTVYGVASLATTTDGTVSVKDSSTTPQEKTVAISSNGSYTADVSGLTAPFVLKASGTDQAGENNVLYSLSTNGGRANINQVSDTAVAAAAEDQDADRTILYSRFNHYEHHRTSDKFEEIIERLRTVLAPLFALYQVSGNPVTDDEGDDNEHSSSGLRAMLRDVQFKVTKGTVTVTNKATGSIIFSGSLKDLASGTFYPENMPDVSGGATACTYTYSDWGVCQSDSTQIRTMMTSTPSGCTGTPVLSQACTYVPPTPSACTYNYSGWGACQSNNTQTRTATSSPAGCTGTPVLSQACTYVPPVTTCNSFTYSGLGHLHEWYAVQDNSYVVSHRLHRRHACCSVTVLHINLQLVHVLWLGNLHEWYAVQDNSYVVSHRLHRRHACCSVTVLHINLQLVHVLWLGNMHERYADQNNSYVDSHRLHRRHA